ncbi:TPA: PAS domain-containing sensor histidine kinase [Legionella feeleii]
MHCTEVSLNETQAAVSLPAQDILACLPCGLVVLNAQGYIVWLNKAAEALLGTGLQGIAWLRVIKQVFAPRADDGHEVSLANGHRLHVAISSLESLPGQLITLTDVTASRDYEQSRANQHRLMAMGRMTAQLAHQIRTPLSSAILYTEHLAAQPQSDSRCLQWITRLQGCHASIEQQIQELLLFAKGEMIELVSVSLQECCNQLAERAQPFIQAESASFTIDNQSQKDEMLLHRESFIGAVLNLVINALQAKANCISLTIEDQANGGVQFKMIDNGLGMPDDVRGQAFTPFFTTKAQGTGLGLAVVYAVVRAHGGEVMLDSLPGQGSCITINLPG